MGEAVTIRNSEFDKTDLRLMKLDKRVFGLADGEICVVGSNADDVWQQLRTETKNREVGAGTRQ